MGKPVLRPEAVEARAISQLDQGFRLPDRWEVEEKRENHLFR